MSRTEILGPPDPNVQVAQAAATLLDGVQPHHLKECENPDCALLFYDESRNAPHRVSNVSPARLRRGAVS